MSASHLATVFALHLPPTQKFLLIALADSALDSGAVAVTHDALAAFTGYSTSQVRRGLVQVIQAGFLVVVDGGVRPVRYQLQCWKRNIGRQRSTP